MRRLAALLAVAVITATTSGLHAASAQEPAESDATAGGSAVPTLVRDAPRPSMYIPLTWEETGLALPLLDRRAVVAVSEDDDQLTFLTGDELGRFRPAPEGGSAFFGSGRPIFGLAAPPVLPSRVLRPLGTGDAGDRFLGERPPIDPTTVIPKLSETFNQRRESFAFLGGPPPLGVPRVSGSPAFPSIATVLADPEPGVPDNIPRSEPPSVDPGSPFEPGPRPTTTVPTTPRTTAPATTIPPDRPSPGTTTSTTSTSTPTSTTTTTTTTTTTSTTTSSTTTSTTSTTTPSTTTTTAPPSGPPEEPVVTTALVMGNTREDNTTCFSNGPGSLGNRNDCERIFEISDATPGKVYRVNLTLWNVDPDSDTVANNLRVFAAAACANGTTGPPHGSNENLCGAVELTIERYQEAARTNRIRCVYGSGPDCHLNPSRNLQHFSANHTSMADGPQIDSNFVLNERAYLVLRLRLPDRGFEPNGRGRDNEYMGRTAAIRFTWRMDSA